jgi:hypothetical protein
MSWINFDRIDWKVSPDGDRHRHPRPAQADLDWRMNDDVGVREYRLPGSGDGKATTFPRREPGPNSDAPLRHQLSGLHPLDHRGRAARQGRGIRREGTKSGVGDRRR